MRGSLALRAARLEVAAGRSDAARTRLERLLAGEAAIDEAWLELLGIARADGGALAALALAERALEKVRSPWVRLDLQAARAQALHDLGRFAEADEVANLIVYLCSPASNATRGSTLRVEYQ